MPIINTDIKQYLSGGASNSNPALSLGGVISSVEVVDAGLHNLFDRVKGDEAIAGDIEYRLVFIKNTHSTLTLYDAIVFVSGLVLNAGDSIKLAVANEAKTTTQAIINESTAPVTVIFTNALNEGSAIYVGDLAPGEYHGIWVKRIIGANSPVANNNTFELVVRGDTEE